MDKKIKVWIEKYKVHSIIALCTIVLLGVIFIIGKSVSDPNTGYLSNQTVDNLSFENANLVYENGITTFTAEVYNESGNTYTLKNISINLTNESNDVTTLIGYIGDTLEKDEGKLITASIDQDLTSSLKLEYVVNK